MVKNHPLYQDPIQKVMIKRTTRAFVKYVVVIDNEVYKMKFHLIENLKNS